jgi:recombination protein RecT
MSNKQLTIKDYMSAPQVQTKMKEMLQSPELIRQFTTSVISIAGADELLAVAEPRSLFNACLTAASLNLPINKNLGFAHIIGYKNNKKGITEAQFQLGARGFKELAQRSGQYQIINQGDVREGELAGRDRLTGELKFNWNDNDAVRADLPIIGYFSYFKLANGFSSTFYMSMDEVIAHGKRYSQSFKRGYGPWQDNFDAMALKTVSKLNISKNGPLSVDMQKAVTVDQAVIHDEDKVDYIDGDELAGEKATDEKKAAILAANAPEAQTVPDNVDPATGEIKEDAPSAEETKAAVDKVFKPEDADQTASEQAAAPAPKKSVKERAAEFAAKGKAANAAKKEESEKGTQSSLINNDNNS